MPSHEDCATPTISGSQAARPRFAQGRREGGRLEGRAAALDDEAFSDADFGPRHPKIHWPTHRDPGRDPCRESAAPLQGLLRPSALGPLTPLTPFQLGMKDETGESVPAVVLGVCTCASALRRSFGSENPIRARRAAARRPPRERAADVRMCDGARETNGTTDAWMGLDRVGGLLVGCAYVHTYIGGHGLSTSRDGG